MRKLCVTDLGLFSRVIEKMDIKSEINKMFFNVDPSENVNPAEMSNRLSMQVIMIILENYSKAEGDFVKLLASLSGKTEKEVGNSSILELVEMLKLLAKDESVEYFLKLAFN